MNLYANVGDEMYGLALQGGGAKGSYHIGVWKALRELRINISAVVGTSVGALDAALIVQDDIDKAISLWENLTTESVFIADKDVHDFFANFSFDYSNIEDYKNIFDKKKFEKYQRVAKSIYEDGGLDITPLKELIKSYLDEDKIRNSECDFGLVTINVTDLKPMLLFIEDIPEGKLIDYLLASSFLPVFKKEKFDGKIFLDGGFYDDLPVDMLVDKNYKKIITSGIKFSLSTNDLSMLKYEWKGIDLTRIKATKSLGGLLQFNPDIARNNIQMGYDDTMNMFNKRKS